LYVQTTGVRGVAGGVSERAFHVKRVLSGL